MNDVILISGLIALLLAGVPGCGDGDPPSSEAASTGESWTWTAITRGGSFEVRARPLPVPLPLNEHFALEVEVRPLAGGSSVEGLELRVGADMPAHGHGINTEPEIMKTGAGTFRVEGLLFHMPGAWELVLDVVAAGKTERAVVPLVLE